MICVACCSSACAFFSPVTKSERAVSAFVTAIIFLLNSRCNGGGRGKFAGGKQISGFVHLCEWEMPASHQRRIRARRFFSGRRKHWGRARRTQERRGDLNRPRKQTRRDRKPPRQVIGTEGVVQEPAAEGADKAADLVADKGNPLDHRLPAQAEHL